MTKPEIEKLAEEFFKTEYPKYSYIDSQVMCSCKADQRKCNSCDLYNDIKEAFKAGADNVYTLYRF